MGTVFYSAAKQTEITLGESGCSGSILKVNKEGTMFG